MFRQLLIFILVSIGLSTGHSYGQTGSDTIPDSVMKRVYEEVKTPFKYGLVMVHEDTSNMVDCPTVFRKGDLWYMTYLIFNGRGYETWLAQSADLLNWEKLGPVLPFTSEERWDWNQAAGYPALVEHEWGGTYELQSYDSKYWMSYFGGSTQGYERGTLSIGMAHTDTTLPLQHEWMRHQEPLMRTTDADAGFWERKKLYKSSVIWDKTEQLGKPFIMYYNAVGDTSSFKSWIERIGMATSSDMLHWERYAGNPILAHETGLTGDAVVQKMGDLYVMFYYGAFWPEGRKDAFNRFACSYDLVHWTDWAGEDLIRSSEPYDIKYAHKPCVVKWKGTVYHFYSAVNELEQRGIAVATSTDKGKSSLNFQKISKKLKR
ncbi:MAG: glycosylase [Flavobacteriales bacterium]|nr:glycosylase [Flavobacteriales bacterium]